MQKSLFARIAARDKAAELPREWLDDLVRYCFAKLGHREEAEDVAMDVWHEASRARGRVSDAECPRAFLIGMARRRIVDHRRKCSRLKKSSSQKPTNDRHDHILLDEVLALIGDDFREALVLKYVHGFSQEEIAAIVGRTPAAVNSLLQRAREAFRQHGAHLASDTENSHE